MKAILVTVTIWILLGGCASGDAERISEPRAPAPTTVANAGSTAASTAPQSVAAEFITAHNRWRREVGVPEIQWSEPIAQRARRYAGVLRDQGCALVHDTDELGENLFQAAAFPNPPDASPAKVVDSWADERKDYTIATSACRPGAMCGHYTQVVWSTTREVGCGSASCTGTDGWTSTVWVCKYSPPGNVTGRKPY